MALDPAAVRRIATLARIRVEDADLATLAAELNGILGWIEQLNEVNVDGIEPLAGSKQHVRELSCEKLPARAAGAVQNEYSVADSPIWVPLRCAQRAVMQLELRQRLAGVKVEVMNLVIAVA